MIEKLDLWLFCLLAILNSAFPSFLVGVSHKDSRIGLGTFPTPWFAWALSAGVLAVSSPLLDPSKTSPIPVCIPLCLSRLCGGGHGDFQWHWGMIWPAPLSGLHWWEDWHELNGLSGRVLGGSKHDSHCLFLHSVQLQQICLCHCCEASSIVSDTEHHTLLQQEEVALVNTLCSHSLQDWQTLLNESLPLNRQFCHCSVQFVLGNPYLDWHSTGFRISDQRTNLYQQACSGFCDLHFWTSVKEWMCGLSWGQPG